MLIVVENTGAYYLITAEALLIEIKMAWQNV